MPAQVISQAKRPDPGPFPDIADYGIIGDCGSAALVSKGGSVEWLCWPRFDSPSIFAACLDRERGGFWKISPTRIDSLTREYVSNSNVLRTRFGAARGSAVLTDLMPVRENSALVPDHEIIRHLVCESGEIEVRMIFFPRENYGATQSRLQELGKLGVRMDAGRGVYWLRSNLPLKLDGPAAFLETRLRAGEELRFSLSYSEDAPAVLPSLDLLPQRIAGCVKWWQNWATQAQYDGDYREEVIRSALTLKLLCYSVSGAIMAAPTTSLPERIDDQRNWDYRYCWLRDASLTIRALLELGYWNEATQFLDWMLHATRLSQPELRILYTVFGNSAPKEWKSEVLRGISRSRYPTRKANCAAASITSR